jgi:hypothetical protein
MAERKRPKRAPLTPRGGTTTVTGAGLARKTVYFSPEEWEAIRREAFETGAAYSDIVRQAVRRALSIPEPGKAHAGARLPNGTRPARRC